MNFFRFNIVSFFHRYLKNKQTIAVINQPVASETLKSFKKILKNVIRVVANAHANYCQREIIYIDVNFEISSVLNLPGYTKTSNKL